MWQITYAGALVLMIAAFACSPRDRQETADRTEAAVEDVGDAAREGANEVREEAGEAREYGYAQRNEFRRDLDQRLEGIDREIAELERDTKAGADRSRDSLVANIREARKTVDRDLDRLGSATENNWEDLKRTVNQSVYSLQQALQRTRPDARPMGGTGPT
jgi:ElaB/YqjD/DUF883 family membrane-anchored ribosome-binding protein